MTLTRCKTFSFLSPEIHRINADDSGSDRALSVTKRRRALADKWESSSTTGGAGSWTAAAPDNITRLLSDRQPAVVVVASLVWGSLDPVTYVISFHFGCLLMRREC